MITLARQTQSTVLEHDNQSIDGDGAARLVQLTSTHTTPSGSYRWRRVFSDTESDGFDSFYEENESNVSFRRYMHFSGEDDTISYTTYGGDSDASIEDPSTCPHPPACHRSPILSPLIKPHQRGLRTNYRIKATHPPPIASPTNAHPDQSTFVCKEMLIHILDIASA
ncbi:Anaphase-promoting complex (APC) [Forsythia ovata]